MKGIRYLHECDLPDLRDSIPPTPENISFASAPVVWRCMECRAKWKTDLRWWKYPFIGAGNAWQRHSNPSRSWQRATRKAMRQ